MSTNVNTNTDKVNDAVDNELKFDCSNSLANNNMQSPLPTVNIRFRGGKSIDITWINV